MVQLDQGKAADLETLANQATSKCKSSYLCVSRIGIEHIRKEFARTSNASNDKAVYVEAINHKKVRQIIGI